MNVLIKRKKEKPYRNSCRAGFVINAIMTNGGL